VHVRATPNDVRIDHERMLLFSNTHSSFSVVAVNRPRRVLARAEAERIKLARARNVGRRWSKMSASRSCRRATSALKRRLVLVEPALYMNLLCEPRPEKALAEDRVVRVCKQAPAITTAGNARGRGIESQAAATSRCPCGSAVDRRILLASPDFRALAKIQRSTLTPHASLVVIDTATDLLPVGILHWTAVPSQGK